MKSVVPGMVVSFLTARGVVRGIVVRVVCPLHVIVVRVWHDRRTKREYFFPRSELSTADDIFDREVAAMFQLDSEMQAAADEIFDREAAELAE